MKAQLPKQKQKRTKGKKISLGLLKMIAGAIQITLDLYFSLRKRMLIILMTLQFI